MKCRDLVTESKPTGKLLQCFDARGRKLLDALAFERRKTGGALKYLSKYQNLLKLGDTFGEVEIQGDWAVLEVLKGRHSNRVIFRHEDGQWRIDLLELNRFWRELDDGAQQ